MIVQSLEKNWLVIFILKLNIHLLYDSVNLLLIIYPRGIKTFVYEMTYNYIHNGFIHNSQKLETTQMSISKTMDKQIIVFSYIGILLSIKNEQTADAHNKMALIDLTLKGKSPCKKVHPVWPHLYEVLEQLKVAYGDWKSDQWLPGAVRDWLQRGTSNFLGC